MKKEFVMRGQTPSGKTEKLSFSGHKEGYAYRLVDFKVYPSTTIGTGTYEITASITAGKTPIQPTDPDFQDDALIATAYLGQNGHIWYGDTLSVINDAFLITQDLIIMVMEGAEGHPVNWQCRFESVKMSNSEQAVTNYKQFIISDE